MVGLLYGILTDTEKREEYFNYVSLVTRDSYQLFIEALENVKNYLIISWFSISLAISTPSPN